MTQQLKLPGIILALLISLVTGPVSAETLSVEPSQQAALIQRVETFLMDAVTDAYPHAVDFKLTVRKPDSRLNLDQCTHPTLALHGTDQIRQRMLVRVSCTASFAIHLSANVEVLSHVVVSSQAVGRKETLTLAHLTLDTVNILANQRQYLTSIDQAVGLTLVRSVRSGTALTTGMVKQPDLVTRGDSVVIVASRGELIVRMPGVAMMTGAMDQQINVKNESSDRVVKGWVKGPGEVHVPF